MAISIASGRLLVLLQFLEHTQTRPIQRPALRVHEKMATDPHFRDHILFYEHFHGDTGRGVGASHQTGWTGLIAKLIQARGIAGKERSPQASCRPHVLRYRSHLGMIVLCWSTCNACYAHVSSRFAMFRMFVALSVSGILLTRVGRGAWATASIFIRRSSLVAASPEA